MGWRGSEQPQRELMNLHQSAWRPSVSLILITVAHAALGHYAMTDKPDSLLPYTGTGCEQLTVGEL